MLHLLVVLSTLMVPDVPFPFAVTHASSDRVELMPDDAAIVALRPFDRARLTRMTKVSLPASVVGGPVALRLTREEVAIAAGAFHLDGRPTGVDPSEGMSIWTGVVEGVARSEVFLALSPHGSWGWIDVGEDRLHLLTERTAQGRRSAWVTEGWALAHQSAPNLRCETESTSLPSGRAPTAASIGAGGAGGAGQPPLKAGASGTILKVRFALETDWHFFSLFGDEMATAAYSVAIIGASNSRYREQVDVVLAIDYLGIHSNPNDGWTQTDIGGDCYAVLGEFMSAWSPGAAPVPADIYHFFTGANTFCAIASGDVCDAGGAYSIMGKMDGLSSFPPAPGPLNWDFVWFCHETGHNFGSPHTHSYCPPLDECAPTGWFGPCQSAQNCITNGTFMSYCHACPGGMSNFTTWFHTGVVPVLRATAESGCLTPFEGVLTTDLGFGLSGAIGTPELVISYSENPDQVNFEVGHGPTSQSGLFISSTSAIYQTFLGVGTLVPAPTFLVGATTGANGRVSFAVPIQVSVPNGITLFTQAWFLDPAGPSGYAASNAIEWELIRP